MKKQKLILESIRYITGAQKSVKIQGKPAELRAYKLVLNASKKLYETLQMKDANLQEIEKLVNEKKKVAAEFKKITGHSWLI